MYAEEIKPYLNTTFELDDTAREALGLNDIFERKMSLDPIMREMWSLAGREELYSGDEKVSRTILTRADRLFSQAAVLSPNIADAGLQHLFPHNFQVPRRCEEAGNAILEKYPFLRENLSPVVLAYFGRVEDSIYLIGGNGETNQNGLESNSVHEILTYVQMKHMGYDSVADGAAMHGVAPQILEMEHEAGRFLGVQYEDRINLTLDILTGVDMLCTRDWLPAELPPMGLKVSFQEALKYRLDDLIGRRTRDFGRNHPLILALDRGGRERVEGMVNRLDNLMKGDYSEQEVREIYSL